MNQLDRAGADPNAKNCWAEMAGSLAPAYKVTPPEMEMTRKEALPKLQEI